MGLYCPIDGGYDGGDWYYYAPKELAPLATKRGRRCCSCGSRLPVGTPAVAFPRYRPVSDRCNYIEEAIYGDEVPLAVWYMCERCGDLYESITELGFCCDIGADLKKQIREYRADNAR